MKGSLIGVVGLTVLLAFAPLVLMAETDSTGDEIVSIIGPLGSIGVVALLLSVGGLLLAWLYTEL